MLFLRVMAVLSILKGLYHWAQVTGFVGGEDDAFENQSMAWQAATVYFAVIELVAAVGLWLATPWGAVVWLTTVVSMAVIELMFPGAHDDGRCIGQPEQLSVFEDAQFERRFDTECSGTAARAGGCSRSRRQCSTRDHLCF